MEYKDIPEGKIIKDMTEEELQAFHRELRERFSAETIENMGLFFEFIEVGVKSFQERKQEIAETASQIKNSLNTAVSAFTTFFEVMDTISNNKKLRNMTLNEAVESGELARAITDTITPTQAKAVNEVLKSKLPEHYYITNNKISNEITKDFLNNGEFSLAVIKPKKPNKKGEIYTYNSLSYEGSEISITGRQQFTAYDRTVHNAVCTLFVAGNDVVTPQMVYRTFNGMTDTEKISPQAIGAVTKSLDKSRFTRLKVDFTAEAKARNMLVNKATIDSNLLQAEVLTVSAGGREVSAYKILKTPALYEYAQLTKQIISVPLSLLDTREATRNTEEIIPIKEYLIRRIEIMKHGNDTSNRIVYDTIFYEAGIIIKHNTERDRYRKYINSILLLWQDKFKYIKKVKEYKEGKSFKGIEITY